MVSEWMYVLWLLLPVAAVSGWYAAKRSNAGSSTSSHRGIPSEYLKGLNYVLNEEQDKAIELFIKMLEVDSDTVETHLALGNLFRRRGEVDRAIRIHQNLIARPTLNTEQRSLALLELGMDYMRSGLFDRAEGLFRELVDSGVYTIQAYTELLDIYQQEKDWHEAIAIARRLEALAGDNLSPDVAQFFCELAKEDITNGHYKEARDNVRRALNNDPKCIRASLLEAELAEKSGKVKAAIKAYKRIERQDPDYLPEVVEPLLGCYREIDKLDECMKYLQDILNKHGGITPLLCLTGLVEEVRGEEAAVKFISEELKKRTTVKGVDKLIEYTLKKTDGDIRDYLNTIKEMTENLLETMPVYKCKQCGFDAMLMHWQCPGCKCWNTIKPVYGVEGE